MHADCRISGSKDKKAAPENPNLRSRTQMSLRMMTQMLNLPALACRST